MRISLRTIQNARIVLIYKDVVCSCLCDNTPFDCDQTQIDCRNCLYPSNPYNDINITQRFRKEAHDFYIRSRQAGMASKNKRWIVI